LRHLRFIPQLTVALPLTAIYRILRAAEYGEPNPHFFDHWERFGQERVIVMPDFFQSRPLGIGPEAVGEDLLGFLSILLSWAKGAMNQDEGALFKGLSWIMPRTDFVGLYEQVVGWLPPDVDLFELVKILACYRNDYSGPQSMRDRIM
jgi:hypothetical protein